MSFELIPAIDLQGGVCVRLAQGRYDAPPSTRATRRAQAARFAAHGIPRLHVVDLDGAKSGHPVNARLGARDRRGRRPRARAARRRAAQPRRGGARLRARRRPRGARHQRAARPGAGAHGGRADSRAASRWASTRSDGRVAVGGLDRGQRGARRRAGAALRGRGRRGADPHRHRARRHARRPEPRGDARARRRGVDSRDRLGRRRVARTTCCARRATPARGLAGAIVGRALYTGALDLGSRRWRASGSRRAAEAHHPVPRRRQAAAS